VPALSVRNTKFICRCKIIKSFKNENKLFKNSSGYQRNRFTMPEKAHKESLKELKEMVQKKDPKEPIEKVLVDFCGRHGISLATCKNYYNQLFEKGEIKKE
jgi:hypothetical protein